MERVETVVIGAGVIGLATARALALAGHEVLILDAADSFGTETSARNSEVIHAGLYYPAGSLKAQLCLRGRDLLYRYLAERHLPHRRCGKLIVATTPAQIDTLRAIHAAAAAAGGGPLHPLTGSEALDLEPCLSCEAALLSPETGILDSHAYMQSLLGDATAQGAVLACRSRVTGGRIGDDGFTLIVADAEDRTMTLACRRLVNAAGHGAADIAARLDGLDPRHVPQVWRARGQYFTVSGRDRFSRLIYPVPEPGGLGIHLTLDLQGAMRFGPDVTWIDRLDYTPDPSRRAHFAAEIRRYWPGLPDEALLPAFCGIRPKLSPPGAPAADFRIDSPRRHGIPGLVQLFGIESPGLTASLAIGEICCMAFGEILPV